MTELADFCDRLGRLRVESGNPTLVWLSGQPLCPSKSQLSKIFRGQVTGLPDADVVRGIVAACVRWAKRYGHAPVLPTDERHWLIERDIVERRMGEPGRESGGAGSRHGRGCTLPRDTPTFLGRETELAALLAHADELPMPRIQVVDGRPGVGKTALAIHAAHLLADRFPDGQFFLDLRGHTQGHTPLEPDEVLAGLLFAVGVDPNAIPDGTQARAGLWRDRLAGRRVLLLLDNARSAEQVRAALPNSPRCLVLVTSRYRLAGLQDANTVALDVLSTGSAADLLVRLAGSAGADDPASLAELVRWCGALPLALSLLASRLRNRPMWTMRYLSDRLAAAARDDGSPLGELHAGDVAVEAAFALSYADQEPAVQRLFRRLALHPGLEIEPYAAAALDSAEAGETAQRLARLYDENLLVEIAPDRYRFHDLIRHYAAGLAEGDPAPQRTAALDRLLRHYASTAGQAAAVLPRCFASDVVRTPSPQTTVSRFADDAACRQWWDTEHSNLSACVDAAAARPLPAAADLLVQLHAQRRLDGRYPGLVSACRTTLGAELPDVTRGHLLCRLGVLEYLLGELESAVTHLNLAHELFLVAGDPAAWDALGSIGIARFLNSDFDAATDTLRATLDGYTRIDSAFGRALTLRQLGSVARSRGDFVLAAEHQRAAAALYLQAGDPLGQVDALSHLAVAQRQLGRLDEARRGMQQVYTAYQRLGSRIGQAHAQNSLAVVQYQTGAFTDALHNGLQARTVYLEIGQRMGAAAALNAAGIARANLGDHGAAEQCYRQVHEEFSAIGDHHGVASNRVDLALLGLALGRYDSATEEVGLAIEFDRRNELLFDLAEALNARGRLETACGDLDAATRTLAEAQETLRAVDAEIVRAQALISLGDLDLAKADPAAALRSYSSAARLAERLGTRPDEARARHGIGRCQLSLGDEPAAGAALRSARRLYAHMAVPTAEVVTAELERLRDPAAAG